MKAVEIFKKTDIGNNAKNNEDSIYSNGKNLFAVSDGMGGEEFGELASQICVEECENFETYLNSNSPIDSLILVIEKANQKILSKRKELKARIGSTFDIVYVDDKIYYAHVGDSRIYHYDFENMKLNLVTTDHTIPGNLFLIGEIDTLEEVRTHPMAHMLLNNMGAKEKIQIDNGIIEAKENDLIMLSSDGFSDSMPHTMIEKLINENYEKENLGEILFENGLSPENDNRDNISLIVFKV